MRTALYCLVVAGMLLIGSLAGAQTLATYDDFEGKTYKTGLDPEKWIGSSDTASGMTTLEVSRLIKKDTVLNSQALNLSSRTYVKNDLDSGTSTAYNGVVFLDGSNVTTIEATVLVKKVQLPVCTSRSDVQPFDTFVRARIGGAFFNAGPRTPNSFLNDIFAWIGVGLATPGDNTLHVYARVLHCDDSNCNNTTWIGYEDPYDLGTVKLNKKVKLRITWDQAGNQFIFRKGNTDVYISCAPYSYADSVGGSNGGNKRIQIQNILPNCTDDPRLFGYIDVSIDKVKTNSLVP
jgi:hypothetical protein